MNSWRHVILLAGLLAMVLPANGCAGRALGKKSAREILVSSHAGALDKDDLSVLAVTQVGSGEAIVEVQLHTAFRLRKIGGHWAVQEVKVGQGQWESLDDILRALQRIKTEETRRDLEKVAAAMESYRQKNGRLPDFSNYVDLSDALYPLYLSPLIREDAWKQPLVAMHEGAGAVRLASHGPDGKPGTQDDIVIIK